MAPAKKADVGDNMKAENERKSLFFHHVRKRIAHNSALQEIREDRKKDGKLAQADGLKLEDVDFAVKAMDTEDKRIISDTYIRHGEILDWLGLVPSFQPDLLRDRMPAIERRQREGELAGLANKPRESGFSAGSEDDQIWLKAYDKGQATFKENIGAALENAEKARQAGTKQTKKKAAKSKAGEPLTGDTPDDAKQAANQNGEAPTPPKPDEEKTNSEKEAERQAAAAFH
jgi:hypothetical protein